MQSCVHHAEVPEGETDCSSLPSYSTPKCTSSCYESAYDTPYSKDKLKATDHYSVKGVENIQKEIMEKGTVSVAMTVYEDFESYSSGNFAHIFHKNSFDQTSQYFLYILHRYLPTYYWKISWWSCH